MSLCRGDRLDLLVEDCRDDLLSSQDDRHLRRHRLRHSRHERRRRLRRLPLGRRRHQDACQELVAVDPAGDGTTTDGPFKQVLMTEEALLWGSCRSDWHLQQVLKPKLP